MEKQVIVIFNHSGVQFPTSDVIKGRRKDTFFVIYIIGAAMLVYWKIKEYVFLLPTWLLSTWYDKRDLIGQ